MEAMPLATPFQNLVLLIFGALMAAFIVGFGITWRGSI